MEKDKKGLYKHMEDLFKFILNNVDKTKDSSKNKLKIKEEISSLRSFVVGARPARLAIVGRRGAGKSSLINAFFGELKAEVGDYKSKTGAGKWYLFENELGGIDILDTRGLGESHAPDEEVITTSPLEEVKHSITEKCPDVLLFLCKAKEVGSRIDEDLKQLLQLKKDIFELHNYDVPIVGIVTQVDELAPVSVSEPPFDDEKKQENIEATVHMLESKLRDIIAIPVTVIPICSYRSEEHTSELQSRGHLVCRLL